MGILLNMIWILEHSQTIPSISFNASKVGKYFKKVCGTRYSIDSEVVKVFLGEQGIDSVALSNGQVVDGDFFVDASGFKRLLMTELGAKWKSYAEYLSVNSAMSFISP